AGNPGEFKIRILRGQPGIDLLFRDKQQRAMTAFAQLLGQSNARRKVSASAAAGDDELTHAITSSSVRRLRSRAGFDQLRALLMITPTSRPMRSRLDSPALMKGSDMPLVGSSPVTTPRFTIACRVISRSAPLTR